MKRGLQYRLCIIFIFALHAPHSLSTQLIIGAENSWPPFSDQQGLGISRDLVEEALAQQNIQIKIEVLPYASALNQTEQGLLNACWNVTRQNSTESQFLFGEIPLLTAKASYFYPPNNDADYLSAEEIPSKTRIGIIIDYEYGDEFEHERKRFLLKSVANQRQIIKLLISNRIDMAIMFDEVALYSLKQLKLNKQAIRKGKINHVSDIYVAFNKDNIESKTYAKALDNGLKTLHLNGEYQRIYDDSRNKMLLNQ